MMEKLPPHMMKLYKKWRWGGSEEGNTTAKTLTFTG
jgi:hypothetical protein